MTSWKKWFGKGLAILFLKNKCDLHRKGVKQIHFEHCPRQTQNAQNFSIFLNFAQFCSKSHFFSLFLTLSHLGKIDFKAIFNLEPKLKNLKISQFFSIFLINLKWKDMMGKKKSQNCSKFQKNAEKCRFFQSCTGCDSCVNRGPDGWNTQKILSSNRARDLKIYENVSKICMAYWKNIAPSITKKLKISQHFSKSNVLLEHKYLPSISNGLQKNPKSSGSMHWLWSSKFLETSQERREYNTDTKSMK